jgi:hypothetical protein
MRWIAVAMTLCWIAPAGAAEDGGMVWKQRCAKCHGETGMAETPTAKALKVPALAGNEKIAGMSGDDLVKAYKANPKHAIVKATDEELQAVVAHVKEMAGKK